MLKRFGSTHSSTRRRWARARLPAVLSVASPQSLVGLGSVLSLSSFIFWSSVPWGSTANACQIPVFRYALERWEPDPYQLFVLHDKPLTPAEQSVVEALRTRAGDGAGDPPTANLVVSVTDTNGDLPEPLIHLRSKLEEYTLPAVVLSHPASAGSRVLLQRPLARDVLQALPHSAARETVAQRLLSGHSVVWVQVDSGNQAADDAAYGRLTSALAKLEKELELPDMEDILQDDEYQAETKVELKLKFSALRLQPNDPEEKTFIELLLAVEPDLAQLRAEPIAVPIFGRARALYGLVGEGIHMDTIRDAAVGLIGPCSCTVKNLNPGVDLLFAVDWNEGVLGSAIPEKPAPELPGLHALAQARETETSDAASTHTAAETMAVDPDSKKDASESVNSQSNRTEGAGNGEAGIVEGHAGDPASAAEPETTGGWKISALLPFLIVFALGGIIAIAGTAWLMRRGSARA